MRPHRTSIWPTRRDLTGTYVHLDPVFEDMIEIFFPGTLNPYVGTTISITRREARMLARRLNQCLDATVKR